MWRNREACANVKQSHEEIDHGREIYISWIIPYIMPLGLSGLAKII